MAVNFNASGDNLTRTTNIPAITSATIMGWFYSSASTGDNQCFAEILNFNGFDGYQMNRNEGSGVFQLYNGSSSVNGSSISFATWYHFAFTISGTSGSNFLGYMNGALDITHATRSISGTTSDYIRVGDDIFGNPFSGNVAAVKIYSAVLTVDEIKQEMRQYAPVRTVNLNGWYPLHTGSDTGDYSGSGNNWTVNGSVVSASGPPIAWRSDRQKRVYIVAAGGGTLYTTTVAGAVNPAGALVRQVNKVVAGVVSPVGGLVKQVNKVVTGGVTPVGVLGKQVRKTVAGAVAVSGVLVRQINKVLAGVVSPTGVISVAKRFAVALAGAVAISGSLVKQVNKVLSGTVSPIGNITKQVNKILAGALSAVGTLSSTFISGGGALYTVTLAGAVAVSGSLTKQARKVVSGVVTPIGVIVNAARYSVILAGAVAVSGALVKQVRKVLVGVVTPSGGLVKQVRKVVSGVVTTTGSLVRVVLKTLTGTLTPVGTLVRSYIRQISLAGVLTPIGTLTSSFISGTGVVAREMVMWFRRRRRQNTRGK